MREKKGDNVKKITATQLSLMKICWDKGEASAREIYEESLKDKHRSYQTIKTLLDRMVDKGYLVRKKHGHIWKYSAKIKEKTMMGSAIDDFVKNMLGNSFTPLLSYFADKKKLKKDDIAALKDLISKAG